MRRHRLPNPGHQLDMRGAMTERERELMRTRERDACVQGFCRVCLGSVSVVLSLGLLAGLTWWHVSELLSLEPEVSLC